MFVEGCSVDRKTILAGRGGPSSGSSPTPLLYAGPVNCLLSSLVISCTGMKGGPIKRKMRLDLQFVKSFCFCSADPFLCLCSWHRVWPELDHSKQLGGFSATKWTAGLRITMVTISAAALRSIFSQCGVWRPCSSIAIGVPSDEIQAGLIAQPVSRTKKRVRVHTFPRENTELSFRHGEFVCCFHPLLLVRL